MARWYDAGKPGEPYPAALRGLRGLDASGVYAIRDKRSGEVLYVGESHSGKLYATLTRHMQGWSRGSSSHRGWTGPNDPGVTYLRSAVQIRWRVSSSRDAMRLESAWIRRLRPRDNVEGQVDAQYGSQGAVDAMGLPVDPPF